MKRIAILGSTGSIGTSTLAVLAAFPDRFKVVALGAGRNIALLRQQIADHQPKMVAVAEPEDALALAKEMPGIKVLSGREGLLEVACHPAAEMLMSALVGSVGLEPTMAAIAAGKDIALANKETLVVAGDLVMNEVAKAGVNLVPVDSEHNAIHQALRVGPIDAVRRLLLTASGGPFRTWSDAQIRSATVADALAHPTWQMGAKITIDSATMINKGLEIIEAHHLFDMPADRIDVLVHPQSLVHSLVEYIDGSQIAQLAVSDMRLPILYALAWPERLSSPVAALDLVKAGQLSFEEPDEQRFPALGLARSALAAGGEMPAVLNASNEVAVKAFLQERLPFWGIAATISAVLDAWVDRNRPLTTLEQALAADAEARSLTEQRLGTKKPQKDSARVVSEN